ncbi:MAG: hypothetical protein L6Q99_18355 [Planctomycetes bacterium]|nr:hypothetical protein [Planctomycetota bacterium]
MFAAACASERELGAHAHGAHDTPPAEASAAPDAAAIGDGMVSGRVIGPDGAAIGGAFVQTIFPGDASWTGDLFDAHGAATRTGSDGTFVLGPFDFAELARLRQIVDRRALELDGSALPSSMAGLFQLSARAPGLRWAHVRVDGPRDDIEIRLARPTTLRVRAVPSGSDTPVVAHFALANRAHGWQIFDATPLLGHSDLEPVPWRVLAWTDERTIGLSPWFEPAAGAVHELDVELQPACTLRVEPWPGDEHAYARLLADGNPLWAAITADPTPGTFHCPAGRIVLEVGSKRGERRRERFELDLTAGETRVVRLTH